MRDRFFDPVATETVFDLVLEFSFAVVHLMFALCYFCILWSFGCLDASSALWTRCVVLSDLFFSSVYVFGFLVAVSFAGNVVWESVLSTSGLWRTSLNRKELEVDLGVH